ncbi:MAG TPA: GspH/FimT family pseudopilin [Gemmatimonadales bacterium]|nr:GspH/FimT family pseudopilin [Gemmatimonadales bacterium]
MRQGYTLVELTLVMAVAGLALGIALPRLASLRDTLDVEQAAREVVTAHRRARLAAILHSRPVVLAVSPDSLAYRLAGAPDRLWRAPGPARNGVVMASAARQVTFSPVGITTGLANASFRLLRGAASRTVVLSRLGRVRVTRP